MLELWNKLFKLKTYALLGILVCLINGTNKITEGKSYLEAIDGILIPLIICIVVYFFLNFFKDEEIEKEIIIFLIGAVFVTILSNILFSSIVLWIILLRKSNESIANIMLWGRSIFGILWILGTGYFFIFMGSSIYSPEQSLLSKIIISTVIFQPLLWVLLLFTGIIKMNSKKKNEN
jgi:hypothetical protein